MEQLECDIEHLKRLGASPTACFVWVQQRQISRIDAIRVVRKVFDISLPAAKEAMVQADGFPDLNSYQAELAIQLSLAFGPPSSLPNGPAPSNCPLPSDDPEYQFLWDGSEPGWALVRTGPGQDQYCILNTVRGVALIMEQDSRLPAIRARMLLEGCPVLESMPTLAPVKIEPITGPSALDPKNYPSSLSPLEHFAF